MAPRGRREISLGVVLLAYQILSLGLENIPPVTLVTVLAQVAIFLGLVPALDYLHITDVCVSPSRVWRSKEWRRLVWPTFVHGDDMHLYYNMVSFLWKGRRLERRFGAFYFAYLLAVFSVLTNVVLVAISLVGDTVWGFALSQQCAVGFSGVIFALKVLCNHYFPFEDAFILGWMPVPSQYACWAELIVIQMLVPNASFVGHSAGILVGLAYVRGPLKRLMDSLFLLASPGTPYDQNIPRSGGYRMSHDQTPRPQPDDRYFRYTGGLSDDEQMRRAMEESVRDFGGQSRPSAPGFGAEHFGRLYPDAY